MHKQSPEKVVAHRPDEGHDGHDWSWQGGLLSRDPSLLQGSRGEHRMAARLQGFEPVLLRQQMSATCPEWPRPPARGQEQPPL